MNRVILLHLPSRTEAWSFCKKSRAVFSEHRSYGKPDSSHDLCDFTYWPDLLSCTRTQPSSPEVSSRLQCVNSYFQKKLAHMKPIRNYLEKLVFFLYFPHGFPPADEVPLNKWWLFSGRIPQSWNLQCQWNSPCAKRIKIYSPVCQNMLFEEYHQKEKGEDTQSTKIRDFHRRDNNVKFCSFGQ